MEQKKIKDIFHKYKELPNTIVVHGGASCLVTNGVHYLDLASNIFNSVPTSVVSQMRNSELNPRSKKLGFWDGYINYNFPKSKKLLFVNSNLNKIKDCVTIYSKNLKIVIEDNSMKFFYVKKNKEKITRLQNPKLKQVIKLENNNYYKKMINSLFKNKKNFNIYKKKKYY